MNFPKILVAGLLAILSASQAARVQPRDLGISVWVPPGWLLSSEGGDSTYRLYTLYDTTGNHGALFTLEANTGAIVSGGAKRWVQDEALVRGFLIEGSCYGRMLSDDSTTINGCYTREVRGRAAICDYDTQVQLIELQDHISRIMASGDIGWVMSFQADTADADTAFKTYRTLLDSMRTDPSFQSLPPVGIGFRPRFGGRPKILADRGGFVVSLDSEFRPEIVVSDLFGRELSGNVSILGEGRWAWRPESSHHGMVIVRIRSGSSRWMDRTILPR